MEHLFQADINGALERITNSLENLNQRSTTEIILQSLESTLTYDHDMTRLSFPEVLNACHSVLFHAWNRRSEAMTCFSVSRYSRGILPCEYYQLIERLNLSDNFKSFMYKLDSQTAILSFQELLPHIEISRRYYYLPTYLRLCRTIKSEETFVDAMNPLFTCIRQHEPDITLIQQLFSIIYLTFKSDDQLETYQCIWYCRLLDLLYSLAPHTIDKHLRLTWSNLMDIIDKKYNSMLSNANLDDLTTMTATKVTSPTDKIITINVTSNMFRDNDLEENMMELWNKTSFQNETIRRRHEIAFELICKEIWKNSVASRPVDNMDFYLIRYNGTIISRQEQVEKWISTNNLLLSHLNSSTNANNKTDISSSLIACMESCLISLRDLHGSWKSIIKAMTQFADLWVRVLEDQECQKLFADLIVMAGFWTEIYRLLNRVIQFRYDDFDETPITERQLNDLSSVVQMVIQQMHVNELLELIYDTYSERILPSDPPELKAQTKELFTDFQLLQKCCNQLVHNQPDGNNSYPVEIDILEQLTKIAAFSPYLVVQTLVSQCAEKKGQHELVVPILEQMGDLCMLRRFPEDRTLLGHVLQALVNNRSQCAELDSLAPFLLSCWKRVRDTNIPILLESYDTMICNFNGDKLLLQPKEFFEYVLLPTLQRKSIDRTSIKGILTLLSLLTEDKTMMADLWLKQLDKPIKHLPIILDMDFDILMILLANLMNERYTTKDADHSISDTLDSGGKAATTTTDTGDYLSLALDLGRKLILALQHTLCLFDGMLEITNDMNKRLQRFFEAMDGLDWRTRLFWKNCNKLDNYNYELDPIIVHPVVIPLILSITCSNSHSLWCSDRRHIYEELDVTQQWTLFLNGCRSNALFTYQVFKNVDKEKLQLSPLWKHPYEATLLQECLVRNLHPTFSITAHYEYRLLLVYFMEQLYGNHSGGIIRLYSAYEDNMVPLVKLLIDQHCRLFFMVLHSIRLIQKITSISQDTCSDDEQVFFVSGTVQAIQSMTNWQQLGKEIDTYPTQMLTVQHIKTMTSQQDLSSINVSHDSQDGIKKAYYPWLETNRISARALCVLVIHAICQAAKSIKCSRSYDVLRVLLLQMVEALEDRPERNAFMDLYHNKQSNTIIKKWKRDKKGRRIQIHLRTVLATHEMELIQTCYQDLPSLQDQIVLQQQLLTPSTDMILYTYY